MGGCAQRKLFTSFLLSILVFMNAAHFKDHMNAPRIGPCSRLPPVLVGLEVLFASDLVFYWFCFLIGCFVKS
jgi:hypothetical protein